MTTSMYCLYVGFDYTYIDINALAQGIKSFLASQVWFQAVARARIYGTDSPAITSQPRKAFGHRDTKTNLVCDFWLLDILLVFFVNVSLNSK